MKWETTSGWNVWIRSWSIGVDRLGFHAEDICEDATPDMIALGAKPASYRRCLWVRLLGLCFGVMLPRRLLPPHEAIKLKVDGERFSPLS